MDDAASASIDAPGDAPGDTPPPGPLFCDPGDSHLVACYEFENNDSGKTRDGSSHHLDATTDHVSFPAGMVGMALQFADDSAADVSDHNHAFDISALTIEAWIKPSQLPSGGKQAYILDVNSQYALLIESNGELHCVLVAAPSVSAPAHLQLDQWAHVACTYDRTIGTAVYVNGTSIGTAGPGGTLATNGNSGMSLAANNPPPGGVILGPPPDRSAFNGLLDQVRLMNSARTAQQICTDAGSSSCP